MTKGAQTVWSVYYLYHVQLFYLIKSLSWETFRFLWSHKSLKHAKWIISNLEYIGKIKLTFDRGKKIKILSKNQNYPNFFIDYTGIRTAKFLLGVATCSWWLCCLARLLSVFCHHRWTSQWGYCFWEGLVEFQFLFCFNVDKDWIN